MMERSFRYEPGSKTITIPKPFDPFDYVEPCEPECSPERHAYHQGQWDMAERIVKDIEERAIWSTQV